MSVRHRNTLVVDDAGRGHPNRSAAFSRTRTDDLRVHVQHSSASDGEDLLVVFQREDVAELIAFLKKEFGL